jgi:hypothetical protein
MHGRSCGYLLAILWLAFGSSPLLWGQVPAAFTKTPTDQSAPWLPPSLNPPDSTPFPHKPLPHKPPGHLPGPGFSPGSGPSFGQFTFGQFTFGQIARTAGTIFAGTVTKIEPGPATGGSAVASVAVTFRVERPLRGDFQGRTLTILEWLGLWSSGQRYVVGEHVLLFLYPPSKLGLTSAIGGALGRFRLDSGGGILLSAAQLTAFQSDPLLAGRPRIAFKDLSQAVRRAMGEQESE